MILWIFYTIAQDSITGNNVRFRIEGRDLVGILNKVKRKTCQLKNTKAVRIVKIGYIVNFQWNKTKHRSHAKRGLPVRRLEKGFSVS